jgi:hypothetical protein
MDSTNGDCVKRRYLFRLDGSKDNDDFFVRRRDQGVCIAYSGTAMSVGPGWIPDLIEVDVEDEGTCFTLTLIELEAAEITARASCRKYLPESSLDIIQKFTAYLETVKRQCLATADPRLEEFDALSVALSGHPKLTVRTAGALRSSSDILELHTLLDQPERVATVSTPPLVVDQSLAFDGTRSFSREETDGLRRAVRVLHAVVTGHDHSGGTLHSWRNLRRKPLDMAVSKDPSRFGELHRLVSNKSASGMRLNCDLLAQELAELWSTVPGKRVSTADVVHAIQRFAPRAMAFSNQEPMRAVYDAARATLQEGAI